MTRTVKQFFACYPHFRRWFKVAPSVEKTEVFKKVASWKNLTFHHRGKKLRFFLIFTKKLSSATLIYLNAHSTLNFARTFTFLNINANQTSKEQDLNFIRINHLFWEQPQRDVLKVNCQAFNFNLRVFLRILVTFSNLF